MWTTPFFLRKVSNYSLVKFGALYETKSSASPCCANISLSLQTAAVDVVEFMMFSMQMDVAPYRETVQHSRYGCKSTDLPVTCFVPNITVLINHGMSAHAYAGTSSVPVKCIQKISSIYDTLLQLSFNFL